MNKRCIYKEINKDILDFVQFIATIIFIDIRIGENTKIFTIAQQGTLCECAVCLLIG